MKPDDLPEEVRKALSDYEDVLISHSILHPTTRDWNAKREAVERAIRRSILEARLDEHEHGHRLNTNSMDRRREDLRKELAALKEGK